MIVLGQFNLLKVTAQLPMGLNAEAEDGTVVFIPYQQAQYDIGAEVNAFVFYNQDNKLEGTLTAPKIVKDQFASLQVISIVKPGAFLDWGLKPDLFLPTRNMHKQIEAGSPVVVCLAEDEKRQQLIADAKIESYFTDFSGEWDANQTIELLVYAKTPLGYKALFSRESTGWPHQNEQTYHQGMLYHNELPTKVRIGQKLTGYIKNVRDDGKVDLTLQRHTSSERKTLADDILDDLRAHGGISSLTDKSPPDHIYQRFKTSKGSYKRALGALYKANKIVIQKDSIKLVE